MSDSLRQLILVLGVAFVYAAAGNITAALWQRFTPPTISEDDLKAVRMMWWVFAPIGLSLLMMYGLDVFFEYLFPELSRRRDV